LEDFFQKRRAEVVKMTQLDYTWERREELIRAEERQEAMELGIEQGIETGRQEGRRAGIQEAMEMLTAAITSLKQGISPEELRAQGMDESVLQKAISLL
jgi:flagellar biosynthesis/type III secretory pathway protein FliH